MTEPLKFRATVIPEKELPMGLREGINTCGRGTYQILRERLLTTRINGVCVVMQFDTQADARRAHRQIRVSINKMGFQDLKVRYGPYDDGTMYITR